MTWFQPPGYVHIMFSQTWAETTVLASAQAEGPITYIPAPQPGFLADGDDVWSGLATLAQAEALCTTNFSTCVSLNARARGCERGNAHARTHVRVRALAEHVCVSAHGARARVARGSAGAHIPAHTAPSPVRPHSRPQVGITYDSTDPNPTTPVQVYLKSVYQFTPAAGWTSLESSRALDTIPFSAQLTGGGKTLVVRAVNAANVSAPLSFDLAPGASFSGADGAGWSLTGSSATVDNTPSEPTAVAPAAAPVPVAAGTHWAGSLPAFTVWVASFALA